MNKAEDIKREIALVQGKLTRLENALAEIQASCFHQYTDYQYYKRCAHCGKVEVLYY
ncbi:serine protease [Thalassobacillus sp. C254]|uniref:serine protease n=1 Tax=Thalassobacillus sp. C254 TaxID=1225341 RepID=UPI0012EE6555|nr:serine protease [Thalassobacillus sp. C254]